MNSNTNSAAAQNQSPHMSAADRLVVGFPEDVETPLPSQLTYQVVSRSVVCLPRTVVARLSFAPSLAALGQAI